MRSRLLLVLTMVLPLGGLALAGYDGWVRSETGAGEWVGLWLLGSALAVGGATAYHAREQRPGTSARAARQVLTGASLVLLVVGVVLVGASQI